KMTYLSATSTEVGPVYLHCWNGWHRLRLRVCGYAKTQFCGFSNWDANYWDLGTDGATSPYSLSRAALNE
ncbi:MAG: hypothetical protein IPM74_19490, partial [Crocinitomicaceae bacterium]|nr:hypothetical protein [Crocinitomicaceae bacterium]